MFLPSLRTRARDFLLPLFLVTIPFLHPSADGDRLLPTPVLPTFPVILDRGTRLWRDFKSSVSWAVAYVIGGAILSYKKVKRLDFIMIPSSPPIESPVWEGDGQSGEDDRYISLKQRIGKEENKKKTAKYARCIIIVFFKILFRLYFKKITAMWLL